MHGTTWRVSGNELGPVQLVTEVGQEVQASWLVFFSAMRPRVAAGPGR